ncbi:MAG: efflux RND transporter periplasmic adaptor subunit [Muribaculaceae bacterium]|nr:efflux RND transporter periplasmic adaptor subunit [Muribaculaceae bacterium]
MKHIVIYSAAALTVVASACSSHKSDKSDAEGAMPVEVAEAVTDSVTLYKEYPGTLTADKTLNIVARVSGTVSGANYQGGEEVKAGQLLFTIDPTQYQNAVATAEANLSTAKSQNEYAEQHYAAVEKAYQSHAVSQMELSEALSDRDQSRSAIKSAEAALADARLQLSYCYIRAPYSGRISTNVYPMGSFINGSASPVTLATLYQDDVVTANFSIEDASFLRVFTNDNNRHLINYDSIPVSFSEPLPHSYAGSMSYMAPNVSTSTGTILLQAHIQNPYSELRSGMYCTISLPYKIEPEALLVRDASIATDQRGQYVYVVNDSNKVVYTPIVTGDIVNDSMRVVNQGLRPGDRYVTSALLKVRNDMPVKPYLSNTK